MFRFSFFNDFFKKIILSPGKIIFLSFFWRGCFKLWSWLESSWFWIFISRLYFSRVKLGNPSKEFYVQIDTGSDILWVTCSPCNGCPTSSGLSVRPFIPSIPFSSPLITWMVLIPIPSNYRKSSIFLVTDSVHAWFLDVWTASLSFMRKLDYHWPSLQIELEFFDPDKSSTASRITCSDDRCTSALQSGEAVCSTSISQNSLCSYSFQYGDGSGTSGYYVSDTLYFDTVTGDEQTANSSATIVFG